MIRVVRHTSVGVEPGICYGVSDVPLSSSADLEIAKVVEQIDSVKTIYSSPLSRCRKLAEKIAEKFNLEVIFDDRVIELNFGDWEMKRWVDFEQSPEAVRWFDNYIDNRTPNGESFSMQIARVREFYNEIKESSDNTVVVTHGGVIRSMLSIVNNIEPIDTFNSKVDFGEIVKL